MSDSPRPRWRALLAGVTSALLATAGVVAIAPAASAAEPASGSLTWGVTSGWTRYLSGTGTIVGSNGTTVSAGVPTFPENAAATDYDPLTHTGTIAYTGSVTYDSPHGFTIVLRNPAVEFAADGSASLEVDASDESGSEASMRRLTLATIDASVDRGGWTAAPTTIASAATTVSSSWGGYVGNPGTPLAFSTATPKIATTTAVTSPTSDVVIARGGTASFTATVTGTGTRVPTGNVEFFATPSGSTAPVSLGTAALVNGSATFSASPSELGGRTVSASYLGSGVHQASSATWTITPPRASARSGNLGVVDTTAPSIPTLAADAETITDVDASWNWSTYFSGGHVKSATGAISWNGTQFMLSGGVATIDHASAVVRFTGSMLVTSYGGMVRQSFTDPTLVVRADGSGFWSADVSAQGSTPTRQTLVEIADITSGTTGTSTVTFPWSGSTATGTWAPGLDSAWHDSFVWALPTDVQPYYYHSGSESAPASKAPTALTIETAAITIPESETPPVTEPPVTEPPVTTPPVEEEPEPPVTTPPVDDEEEAPAPPAPAEVGTLRWGFLQSWRTYILGPIASGTITGTSVTADGIATFTQVDGGDFDAASGRGTQRYSGSVSYTGHHGALSMTLADPYVTFNGDGTGSLTAAITEAGETKRYTLGTVTGALADGTLTDAVVTLSSADQLPSGWSRYAGQTADPLSLAIRAAAAPVTPAPTPTPTPAQPAPTPLIPTVEEPVAQTPAPAAEEQETCVARSVSGGTLTWGVKESFRAYITGSIANGAVSFDGVENLVGSYRWSGGSGAYNAETREGQVRFPGSVHFTGHDGALDLTINGVRVQLTGSNTANLIANLQSASLSGDDVNVSSVVLATLSLGSGSNTSTGSRVSYENVAATLTATGATAFGGFYEAGDALDPVSFSLPLGAEVDCDATTGASSSLAYTGSDAEGNLAAGMFAVALLVLGSALVVARRRKMSAQG